MESVRPPMSNVQPPLVTSMLSPIVTDVALHGPPGATQSTVAVLATGSGPHVWDVAVATRERSNSAHAISSDRGRLRDTDRRIAPLFSLDARPEFRTHPGSARA
jgi:hypothetical protein